MILEYYKFCNILSTN